MQLGFLPCEVGVVTLLSQSRKWPSMTVVSLKSSCWAQCRQWSKHPKDVTALAALRTGLRGLVNRGECARYLSGVTYCCRQKGKPFGTCR